MPIVKPRIHYFDMMKGLAIYLVVMGHVLTFCVREIDRAFLFKLIGEIHMPLFFFISGYFSYKRSKDGKDFVMPRLLQRFKQLIIPFFVVSALWLWYYPHSGLQTPLTASFHDMYYTAYKYGYWFTLCLFEIIVVYAITIPLLRLCKRFIWELLIVVFISAVLIFAVIPNLSEDIYNLIGLPLVAMFFPCFMIGCFARKYNAQFDKITSNSWWFTGAILIGGILMYIRCYHWEFDYLSEEFQSFICPLLHLALVVIAVNLVKPWSESAYAPDNTGRGTVATRIFSYLGQESLAIYLLHYFFLFPLGILREPLIGMGLGFTPLFAVAFVVTAVIVAITLGVNFIIQRSKPLALLLTGKL